MNERVPSSRIEAGRCVLCGVTRYFYFLKSSVRNEVFYFTLTMVSLLLRRTRHRLIQSPSSLRRRIKDAHYTILLFNTILTSMRWVCEVAGSF